VLISIALNAQCGILSHAKVCWCVRTLTLLLHRRYRPPQPPTAVPSTGHRSYIDQPTPATTSMGARILLGRQRLHYMATQQGVLVSRSPNAAAVWAKRTMETTLATNSGPQHRTKVIRQPAGTHNQPEWAYVGDGRIWAHTKVCGWVCAQTLLMCGSHGP
jgi:hypothetical protein